MSGGILAVERVTKSFGGLRVIHDLDISIAPGEVRCIIGPNGAGKSTLFKLVVGVLRTDAGVIRFDGRLITKLQPFARARLGLAMKYQTPGIYADLTVEENLAIPLKRVVGRGAAISEETERLLEEFHLENERARLGRELSHGNQQWLEIAMTLATRPKLLLLDEPTAGMSAAETTATAELVRRISRAGVTVVVIEHDMAFVRELGAAITVLHQGRVFAEGVFGDIELREDVRRIYLGDTTN